MQHFKEHLPKANVNYEIKQLLFLSIFSCHLGTSDFKSPKLHSSIFLNIHGNTLILFLHLITHEIIKEIPENSNLYILLLPVIFVKI